MNLIPTVLNGYIMPFFLVICGIYLAFRIKIFKILRPGSFFKNLRSAQSEGGTSPFVSLCTALAGTLGVGNIAGVATAITAGGPGAVFWMWVGAIVSVSVKYGEVVLAVRYRRCERNGYYGGAMYTICETFSAKGYVRTGDFLGTIFAILCVLNSFVMGNLLQVNSAAYSWDGERSRIIISLLFTVGTAAVVFFKAEKIGRVASVIIPPLSLCYIIFSLFVIFKNCGMLPGVLKEIISGAFSFRSVASGAAGIGVREAIRFGFTRGIFSNEAGCGTSPTAHASSNTESPHKQGCFGIFEVVFDTLILCSLTAFVILICRNKLEISGLDGVDLTLEAFRAGAGTLAYRVIGVSVVLFAYATVIAQIYYGKIALRFITKSKIPEHLFGVIMTVLAAVGAYLDASALWFAADIIIGIMTVINTSVLILGSRSIESESKLNERSPG